MPCLKASEPAGHHTRLLFGILCCTNLTSSSSSRTSALTGHPGATPTCRDLSDNALKGPLPLEWGVGFDELRLLNVSFNQLSGGFPSNYSQPDAFPKLRNL